MSYGEARPLTVWCSDCEEWKQNEQVAFLDIAEGMMGEDIVTFRCPDCGKEHKSPVRG